MKISVRFPYSKTWFMLFASEFLLTNLQLEVITLELDKLKGH